MLFLGLNRRCRRAPLYRAETPSTAPAWVLYGSGRTYKGLEVLRQQPLDWNGDGGFIDCFSLLRRPRTEPEPLRGSGR